MGPDPAAAAAPLQSSEAQCASPEAFAALRAAMAARTMPPRVKTPISFPCSSTTGSRRMFSFSSSHAASSYMTGSDAKGGKAKDTSPQGSARYPGKHKGGTNDSATPGGRLQFTPSSHQVSGCTRDGRIAGHDVGYDLPA